MPFFFRLCRSRAGLGWLLFFGSSFSIFAQESAPPLSLDEALRRAVAQNPSLLSYDYASRAAEALIDQAGVRPNPVLDVELENFAGTGTRRGIDGLEATVQARQTFERGGKREKRLAVARREHEASDRQFGVQRNQVLAATVAAYVETLAAQERLKLAAAPLALARETAEAAAVRVKAAAASSAETARARASLASAQADYARAEAGLVKARATLAACWGGVVADVAWLAGRLPIPTELPAEDVFLAKLTTHPRFDLQQAIIAGRRAALQVEQSRTAQDVTVGGGVRFLRDGSDAALVAGVSVPLPFRQQNQGNIRAARETLAGAEQSVRAIEHELRVAFTAAWQDLQTARGIARSLRAEALPATEEAHALVRHAYAQGELPLLDVLDAQRALSSLRREIFDADAASALALVRVEALTDPAFTLTTQFVSRP